MKPTTHQKRAAQCHGEPREQTGEPGDCEPIRYLVFDGSVEVPDDTEPAYFFDDKGRIGLRWVVESDKNKK